MRTFLIIGFVIFVQLGFAQNDSLYTEQEDTNTYYSGLMLQVFSGPLFTNNLYTKTNLNHYSNPIDPKSLNTERISYLLGVNIGYLSQDWVFSTGIHFSDRSADYTLIENKEIIQGEDTNTVQLTVNYINRYKDLHIPLSVGYVSHWNRWILTIKTGIYLSINVFNDGYTYDFQTKELIILNDNLSKFLVSYSLDASLKYQLNSKLGVFVEPYYISGMNTMWKDSPVYAWKQIHYGLTLGLEYFIK